MSGTLESTVVEFARELSATLAGTLPNAPGFDARVTVKGDGYFVRTCLSP